MMKIKGLMVFTFMLILLSIVVAADDYHWECLHKGDALIRFTCTYSCCIVCVKDGYTRLPGFCSSAVYCGCIGGGDPDLVPPEITLNAPRNGYLSGSRLVPLDVFISEPVKLYSLDSQREKYGYKQMCTNCQTYRKSISFDEGFHVLTFKATDSSGNVNYRTTSFTVDSIKPLVKKTAPKSGEYINTIFNVGYDELNLMNVTLHYKENGMTDYTNITKKNCPAGKGQSCEIELNNLSQGELWYYFTLTDVTTSVDSKPVKVYVDTIPPEILSYNSNDYYSDENIKFGVALSEKSTFKYIDYSDIVPKYKNLCSGCTSFNKSKSFTEGFHNVTMRATDKAGNNDEVNVMFLVDSKKPIIKSVVPNMNSYTDGSFTVKYDEENVQSISLMYKEDGSSSYASATRHDCPSGKNKECTIEVNGLAQGELWYYFVIQDRTFREESRKVKVKVDTVAPQITLNNAGGTFDRYYPFDAGVSEKVRLEYIDHTEPTPRYKSLCLKCDTYTTRKYFKRGDHSLTVRATDGAGNRDEESFSFMII